MVATSTVECLKLDIKAVSSALNDRESALAGDNMPFVDTYTYHNDVKRIQKNSRDKLYKRGMSIERFGDPVNKKVRIILSG